MKMIKNKINIKWIQPVPNQQKPHHQVTKSAHQSRLEEVVDTA